MYFVWPEQIKDLNKTTQSSLISRRVFLKLAMLAGSGFVVACNKSSTPGSSTLAITPASTGTPGNILPTASTPGSMLPPTPIPADGATALPTQAVQPIKNVIILIEENHSFDSLFAGFPNANSRYASKKCPETVTVRIDDPRQYNEAYMCSYTENEIPNYWKMASSFTLCDNYFSEVRAPSCPNFLMLGTAQSLIMDNPPTAWRCPDTCYDITALPNLLDEQGITWHDYGGNNAVILSLQGRSEISFRSLSKFYQDAKDGNLQNVIWINTFLLGGRQTSGHPPGNICDAENYAVDIVNAIMNSPQWPSTLLFIVWDEWGGFYDHVSPPVVEKLLDGIPFRYGGRVPCIVVSPYARANFVSHTEYSHVSILKTIETIFKVQALNERDATANTLLDCLDFNQQPLAPITLYKRQCK